MNAKLSVKPIQSFKYKCCCPNRFYCPTSLSCPVGYTLFTGSSKCYKFVDKEVSIKEAYMACKKEGAVLASVHNAATNNHLSSFTSSRIWLGGHNPTSPSDPTTWTWNLSDGSAWGSMNHHHPGLLANLTPSQMNSFSRPTSMVLELVLVSGTMSIMSTLAVSSGRTPSSVRRILRKLIVSPQQRGVPTVQSGVCQCRGNVT